MTKKQEIIKYNDNLLTDIAKVKYPSLELHHIIHRANLLYRYDFKNLVAVCRYTHNKIHFEANGNIDFIKKLKLKQRLWIEHHKNDSFKDYLLKHGQN